MKRIEDIILEYSAEPKAKLYLPARKAFEAPDTGITIIKPAAYKVIKDCAETTLLFLPIEIFLKFKTPTTTLKGKFSRDQVVDLYNRTTTDSVAKILFQLIVDTCPKAPPQLIPANTTNYLTSVDPDDPYGSYGEVSVLKEEPSKSLVDTIMLVYS